MMILRELVKIWVVTALAVGSSGCAYMKEALSNRVVCTVSHDKSFIASMWGWFGIVTPLDPKDGSAICPSLPPTNNEVKK